MLVRRQRRKQTATLRDEAQAEPRDPVRGLAEELLAAEPDRAGRGSEHAHDGLAQRRLAHAVAPDDRNRSFIDGERYILQDVSTSVERVEAADLQRGDLHCLYLLPV